MSLLLVHRKQTPSTSSSSPCVYCRLLSIVGSLPLSRRSLFRLSWPIASAPLSFAILLFFFYLPFVCSLYSRSHDILRLPPSRVMYLEKILSCFSTSTETRRDSREIDSRKARFCFVYPLFSLPPIRQLLSRRTFFFHQL